MDDSERFTLHWTAAQPAVGSYIGSLVPDFQEAEDLLQDVAIVLLRKFAQYDERRPFVAWALGVAKFEILSSRRRHARSFLTVDSDLRYEKALKPGEIAGRVGLEAPAVRMALTRTRAFLRDCVERKLKSEDASR
jgi:RNA polymerase sigma-70 factor (ECF subfamily)